ncbi:hypothetical protein Tco_0806517 [Tanacetum coccineum]
MTTLPFADIHNLVSFLDKPAKSARFEQIVDFLNASSIRYALTVNPIIYTSRIQQFWATAKVKTVNGEVQLKALVDGKKVIITKTRYEKPSQKLTFYKAFFSPQWKFLIHTILMVKNVDSSVKFRMYPRFVQVFLDKQVGDMSTHDEIFVTPSHTKKVFSNMKRIGKGFSKAVTPLFPTMMVQAQEEMGAEPIVDEAANEENVPTQSNDPPLLRVNILGSGEDRLTLKELMDLYTKLSDRVLDLETTKTAQAKEIANLKKRGRKIDDIDKDAKVTLVNETQGRCDDAQMFDTYVFNGEEVFVVEQSEKVVEEVVSTAEVSAAATITIEEITLAQALAELRSAKPKIVDKSQCKVQPQQHLQQYPKLKALLLETLADRLLTKRLQAREQEELTDEHKARLFIELLEKRKKHFAALRAQEKRNKPPTKAQKKSTMSAYLKNMAGYKQSQLKNKARKELEQEVAKKQKIDDDQEEAEMKKLIKVAPDEEEVAIDAIPLATKPPSIVDWKIVKEGKISLFQIIRANVSSKRYSLMIQILRDFDREDLETQWKLVKAKHGSTRPEEGYKRVLWGNLRTI